MATSVMFIINGIMTCDCIRMQQLLQKSNNETSDIMETFKAISTFEEQPEDSNEHYFEVRLFGVPQESGLLDEDDVIRYLSETAPIDFDSQQFPQARKIRDHFSEKGFPITCYKILRGARKKPIYKLYSRSLSTGKQGRTKTKDYVRDVEFIYKEASDGKPLYIGWLAITDFSGVISDESVQGIRFRKGILFNYKDKPEDLYERLKINIELNRELGIQIFSFPMKYSPINRTDRSYIGVNWTKKSIRAISAILQVTKGVVAAGSDFFYKAFGNTLEEYFELLAMPRELIMFRHHFEENGTTAAWKKQYQAMSDEQKKELMEFTSHTVAELKQTPCPEQFQEILPYYLIKYNGKKDQLGDGAVQLSLMDDSDIVVEDQ